MDVWFERRTSPNIRMEEERIAFNPIIK